ncbi:hypothetical protein LEN26_006390 [Aphanomyces euteiches]|nr:hypothetical protein AeMF1_016477 [Aphanomyces euteiches]KAH9135576.1 hypothetical protein LEN26_006390 [Aphanomyces euteiches]KAH9193857.1 hypothetical protein AeNC1_004171 [Aphanomyces euteiches]
MTTPSMTPQMVIFRAEAHVAMHKTTLYQHFKHSGPQRANPCIVHVPQPALIWDWGTGIMSFRDLGDLHAIISRCRCGYVFHCYYFHSGGEANEQVSVALKLMDKRLIELEKDDIEAEVRALQTLQHPGLDSQLFNKHMIRWEIGQRPCPYNHYIATEYVSNGSLLSFMHKKFRDLRSRVHLYGGLRAHPVDLGKNVGVWFLQMVALPYIYQILSALAYIHSQNVCHLDLDPSNIAVDINGTVRLLDFGSSHIMDGRQSVGGGRDFPQIKTKVVYRSPELKKNSRDRARYMQYLRTRPPDATFRDEQAYVPHGFNGAKSDIFSAGVVSLELVLFGFNYVGCAGNLFVSLQNPMYREQFRAHCEKTCVLQTCLFCAQQLPIPSFVFHLIAEMMTEDPLRREHDAVQLANKWKKYTDDYMHEQKLLHASTPAAPATAC